MKFILFLFYNDINPFLHTKGTLYRLRQSLQSNWGSANVQISFSHRMKYAYIYICIYAHVNNYSKYIRASYLFYEKKSMQNRIECCNVFTEYIKAAHDMLGMNDIYIYM